MQLEGLADVQFQYNFYAGEDIITDPYAGVIYGNERWGRQAEPGFAAVCAGIVMTGRMTLL